MSYNNKIQIIIDKMGLSQKDFANKLGVSQNAISHYLLGKRNPDINTIQKLIDLGVSPLFLFSDSKNPFDETYKLFSEANKYLNENNKNELILPMNEFIRKYNLINVIKLKIEKLKGQNFFQKIIEEFSNRGERTIKLLYYFIIYIENSQKDFDFFSSLSDNTKIIPVHVTYERDFYQVEKRFEFNDVPKKFHFEISGTPYSIETDSFETFYKFILSKMINILEFNHHEFDEFIEDKLEY